MTLALQMRERFAKRLARFVERERRRVGCAATAIAGVARKIGMSKVAVYRAMNGYGSVKIQAHHHAALLMHALGIVKAAVKFRRSAKSHETRMAS
jgi:DNA-binding phage protein